MSWLSRRRRIRHACHVRNEATNAALRSPGGRGPELPPRRATTGIEQADELRARFARARLRAQQPPQWGVQGDDLIRHRGHLIRKSRPAPGQTQVPPACSSAK
jgi:hypothetical protein